VTADARLEYAGRRITLPDSPESRGVFAEVVASDCYGIAALAASGFTPRVCWDLGAAWGFASLVMARHWPEAVIWAFEPREERLAYARENLSPLPGVRLIPRGLVGYFGRDKKRVLDGIAHDGLWRKTPGEALGGGVEERCTSVAAFLREYPAAAPVDFLKIDIEGCEIGVLREARQLRLLESLRRIRGEWHFNAFVDVPRVLGDTHEVTMGLPEKNPWGYFEASSLASS